MIRPALDLIRKHLPKAARREPSAKPAAPQYSVGEARPARSWLDGIAPLLGISFLFSFVWDVGGIVRILSVSGLIGFGTNWLAITMLFRPRRKRPLLGWGLIPSQKERIAESLSASVSRNLINPDLIRARLMESKLLSRYLESMADRTADILTDADFRRDLDQMILDHVRLVFGSEDFRRETAVRIRDLLEEASSQSRLENLAFKAYRKVRGDNLLGIIDNALLSVPSLVEPHLEGLHEWLDTVSQEARLHAPGIEDRIIDALHSVLSELDLTALIRDTVRGFDEQRLEGLITGTTSDQLRHIQQLGGVLGVFGGLLIWNPVPALLILSTGGLIIWGMDDLITRLSRGHG